MIKTMAFSKFIAYKKGGWEERDRQTDRDREREKGREKETESETRSRSGSRYLYGQLNKHDSKGWVSHFDFFFENLKKNTCFYAWKLIFDTLNSKMISILLNKFEFFLIFLFKIHSPVVMFLDRMNYAHILLDFRRRREVMPYPHGAQKYCTFQRQCHYNNIHAILVQFLLNNSYRV